MQKTACITTDLARMQRKDAPAVKPSKYRNVKVSTADGVFDSKKEHAHWLILKAREKAGEIYHLGRQTEFPLYCPDPSSPAGDTGALEVGRYMADFTFHVRGESQLHVQDVKGGGATKTALYRWKKKHLELQEGLTIEEV